MKRKRRRALVIYVVCFDHSGKEAAKKIGGVLYDRLTRPRDDELAYGGQVLVFYEVDPKKVDLNAAEMPVVVPVIGKATSAVRNEIDAAFESWLSPSDAKAVALDPAQLLVIGLNARAEKLGQKLLRARELPAANLFQASGDLVEEKEGEIPWLDWILERLASRLHGSIKLFVSHVLPPPPEEEHTGNRMKPAQEAAAAILGRARERFAEVFEVRNLAREYPYSIAESARAPDGSSSRSEREAPFAEAKGMGVFIAVRGDDYNSSPWCREQMQLAKRYGLTVLAVEALDRGESLSMAYGGNSATIPWRGQPAAVLQQALVEFIRDQAFLIEAREIERRVGLEIFTESVDRETGETGWKDGYLTRPPELFNWSWRFRDARGIVLHPDPELPVLERETLRRANPALHLATPSSVLAPVLRREPREDEKEKTDTAKKNTDEEKNGDEKENDGKKKNEEADPLEGRSNPLHGQRLAISFSESSGVDGPEGFHPEHVWDAVVAISRAVVSAGSEIAYGGDWRKGGFTGKLGKLLVQLVETYNKADAQPVEFLHNYLPARWPDKKVPQGLPVHVHDLASEAYASCIIVPATESPKPHREALGLSDMRRIMAREAQARVVLGGKTEPQLDKERKENEKRREEGKAPTAGLEHYAGRFPGIVEEAWWTLQREKPLYIVGGYGGAAGLVADLLEATKIEGPPDSIPEALRDGKWYEKRDYREFTKLIDGFDNDSFRDKLGLPASMDDMAVDIHRCLKYLVKRDWNGLTADENHQLARSRDPLEIAYLITKGLLEVRRERFRDLTDKNIELVHGSITDVETLDGIAISVLDGQPLGGAGAAINDLLGGRATLARGHGSALLDIDSNVIDADWLFLASLGQPTSLFDVECESSDGGFCCTQDPVTRSPPEQDLPDQAVRGVERSPRAIMAVAAEGDCEQDDGEAEQGEESEESFELGPLGGKIAGLSSRVAEIAGRHGFKRLGIVTFGASLVIGDDDVEGWIEAVAEKILDGFGDSLKKMSLFWFETDQKRYEALSTFLKRDERIALTTRVIPPTDDWSRPQPVGSAAGGSKKPDGDYWLHVSLDGIRLKTVLLPPAGRGPARSCCSSFWQDELDDLASESPAEWQSRKVRIERLLLGEQGLKLVDPQSRLMVVHDDACSRIPFELLRPPAVAEEKDGEKDGQEEEVDQAGQPAVGAGVCRFLSTVDPSLNTVLRRPPRSADLRLLLVAVDALENLPGIEAEAEQIRKILFPEDGDSATSVRLTLLVDDQVTRENFLKHLGEADILHFAGHAFSGGGGADKSGLLLWKREKLTVREMQEKHLPTRFAFVNSCKTGRVVGEAGADQASAFATIFLRSGIEAYLGTYWNVEDKAATAFAGSVYRRLNEGKTLEEAVGDARGRLRSDEKPDWANYRLFGDGRLQLKR